MVDMQQRFKFRVETFNFDIESVLEILSVVEVHISLYFVYTSFVCHLFPVILAETMITLLLDDKLMLVTSFGRFGG